MKRIIISEGDPSGIGSELLEKSNSKFLELAKDHQIVYITSSISKRLEGFELLTQDPTQIKSQPGLYQWKAYKISGKVHLGKPGVLTGKISLYSLKTAIHLQKQTRADLITIPLSKKWVMEGSSSYFSGHTEFLAKSYSVKTWMLMYCEKLSVLLLTTHIPLQKVTKSLQKLDIDNLTKNIKGLKSFMGIKSFCILGINPHAGEGGKIGHEEELLIPIIKQLSRFGRCDGPISADSAFVEPERLRNILFIASYHDQGLIPFKMIAGKEGVNVTLGLPFVRVSPDHGPAYNIAGKDKADPTSFLACLDLLTMDKRR